MSESSDPIRLTDILTNAAALADLDAAATISAGHLLQAIDVLRGESRSAPAERPRSPLGRGGRRAVVEPAVRTLSQHWFAQLGRDPLATLSPAQLDAFVADLRALEEHDPEGDMGMSPG